MPDNQHKPRSRYSLKQKMTLEAQHKRHQPPVHGCHPIICPDLFGSRHLGEADTPRGRFVQAFAWVMDRFWPTERPYSLFRRWASFCRRFLGGPPRKRIGVCS